MIKKLYKKHLSWRIKRYYVYSFVTIFLIIAPWITINGNHFFLFSFDHKMINLLFIRFDMQELYLMPFLLIIMFLSIFWLTVLGGRIFCGWMCPQTIFRVVYRDFIETKLLKLRKRVANKQFEPDYSLFKNKIKKVTAIGIWSILSFLAAANLGWYFVPPEDFFVYIQNPSEHKVVFGGLIGLSVFLIYDIVFLKENFCIYVCPYSRVQSVMYDDDTVMSIYDYKRGGEVYDENKNKLWAKPEIDDAECLGCEGCVKICPTHIDIRQGMQLECINCLECVDVCTTVMGTKGKESLIRWSSSREAERHDGKTRFIRAKTIGGAIILTLLFFGLIYMGSTKEHMLLSINKQTRLYSIDKSNNLIKVSNSYIFLFQNTDNIDHRYYFEILDNDKIKIKKPIKPFLLKAGFKKKKVVTLYTTEQLASKEGNDKSIPIKIKAYAVDKKDKIFVERDAIFMYPSKLNLYEN